MEKIEKKVTINAPASKVWQALTDQDKLKEWMMMPTTFEPVVGKEFTFKAEGMEGWDGYFHCTVKEVEEKKKLVYTWNSGMINADTMVTILISENNGKTELTLIHTGWEKLTAEMRSQMIEGHSKGWDERFVKNLSELLAI
ncbi:MAG TPA: SRPBCC domain-containing protein [Ignavibacteriaceae bacterium]|nr:SRPBCC domain-containing protein [Ignavibacteriaceae bacterium]